MGFLFKGSKSRPTTTTVNQQLSPEQRRLINTALPVFENYLQPNANAPAPFSGYPTAGISPVQAQNNFVPDYNPFLNENPSGTRTIEGEVLQGGSVDGVQAPTTTAPAITAPEVASSVLPGNPATTPAVPAVPDVPYQGGLPADLGAYSNNLQTLPSVTNQFGNTAFQNAYQGELPAHLQGYGINTGQPVTTQPTTGQPGGTTTGETTTPTTPTVTGETPITTTPDPSAPPAGVTNPTAGEAGTPHIPTQAVVGFNDLERQAHQSALAAIPGIQQNYDQALGGLQGANQFTANIQQQAANSPGVPQLGQLIGNQVNPLGQLVGNQVNTLAGINQANVGGLGQLQGTQTPTLANIAAFANQANPYIQQASAATLAPITEALTEQVLPALRGSAIGAGQYGGSRQGLAEQRAVRGFIDRAAQAVSPLQNQLYNQLIGGDIAGSLQTQRLGNQGNLQTQALQNQRDLGVFNRGADAALQQRGLQNQRDLQTQDLQAQGSRQTQTLQNQRDLQTQDLQAQGSRQTQALQNQRDLQTQSLGAERANQLLQAATQLTGYQPRISQTQAALGTQQGLLPSSIGGAIGQQYRSQEQQALDNAYNAGLSNTFLPLEIGQSLLHGGAGLPGGSTTTTGRSTGPSPFQQITGAAATIPALLGLF